MTTKKPGPVLRDERSTRDNSPRQASPKKTSRAVAILRMLPTRAYLSSARQPSVVRGIGDGVLATVPMTVFMLAAKRLLPAIVPTAPAWVAQLQRLPPSDAGARLARRFFVPKGTPRKALGLLAHFAIGGAAGAAYATLAKTAPLTQPRPLWQRCAIGAGFGLAVWATGYLGVLPALSLTDRPRQAPKGHTAIMVAAHLIFGATLASLYSPAPTKVAKIATQTVGLPDEGYYLSSTVS